MAADVEETCEKQAFELCCPDLCIKSRHLCMYVCVFTSLYIITCASALRRVQTVCVCSCMGCVCYQAKVQCTLLFSIHPLQK